MRCIALNGLEAFRQLKQKMPGIKFVFLTMNEDQDLGVEAMKCGASGYVLKKGAASELLQAMQLALRGKTYVTPQIARGMQDSFIRNPEGCESFQIADCAPKRSRPPVSDREVDEGSGECFERCATNGVCVFTSTGSCRALVSRRTPTLFNLL